MTNSQPNHKQRAILIKRILDKTHCSHDQAEFVLACIHDDQLGPLILEHTRNVHEPWYPREFTPTERTIWLAIYGSINHVHYLDILQQKYNAVVWNRIKDGDLRLEMASLRSHIKNMRKKLSDYYYPYVIESRTHSGYRIVKK